MRFYKWLPMMVIALLAFGVSAAIAERTGRPASAGEELELTAEEQAFLDRANELRKEIKITNLELALLEAKDAPEGEIATKAEQLYRLQGQAYALRAKNRDLARKLWRHERGDRHRWGMGRGMGRGMHRGMGRGMGHGRHRGMGQWGEPGRGHGRRGTRFGMGHGGRGMGRGVGGPGQRWRLREGVRDILYVFPEVVEPDVAMEEEFRD
ncbi:MAG: hypothetical protein JSV79_02410 [Armatimonadota bacterium]|nr:MAG: hypothetical protein JSV79_02410 [Armatimonadota bacterium]